jgi:hypothetical protein
VRALGACVRACTLPRRVASWAGPPPHPRRVVSQAGPPPHPRRVECGPSPLAVFVPLRLVVCVLSHVLLLVACVRARPGSGPRCVRVCDQPLSPLLLQLLPSL